MENDKFATLNHLLCIRHLPAIPASFTGVLIKINGYKFHDFQHYYQYSEKQYRYEVQIWPIEVCNWLDYFFAYKSSKCTKNDQQSRQVIRNIESEKKIEQNDKMFHKIAIISLIVPAVIVATTSFSSCKCLHIAIQSIIWLFILQHCLFRWYSDSRVQQRGFRITFKCGSFRRRQFLWRPNVSFDSLTTPSIA